MKSAIEKYLNFLNNPGQEVRKELFDDVKVASIQVVLHKIPNLINDKQILWCVFAIIRDCLKKRVLF